MYTDSVRLWIIISNRDIKTVLFMGMETEMETNMDMDMDSEMNTNTDTYKDRIR